MKTILLTLAITLAAAVGFSDTSFAQTSGNSFVVSNQQSLSLGEVTVNAPNGNYYMTIPGNANDTVAMTDSVATSVTINGQTVPQGVNAIVTLLSGKQVAVIWPALNEIIVIDEGAL